MPSPWSPRREVSPETSRLLIERAHDEFVGGNAGDPRLRQVRDLVQDSWRRSLAHLVGPDGTPPLDLSEEEIEAYRSAHPLAGAMDMIRSLLLPESDAGVVVAVGDAATTIVDEALAVYPELWAAGGTPHTVFPLSYDELVRLTSGTVAKVD